MHEKTTYSGMIYSDHGNLRPNVQSFRIEGIRSSTGTLWVRANTGLFPRSSHLCLGICARLGLILTGG